MGLGDIANMLNKAKGGREGSKAEVNFLNGFGHALTGFKTGGTVKKTGLALVHKNEFVLPLGIKPTKAQKSAVRKLKNKC